MISFRVLELAGGGLRQQEEYLADHTENSWGSCKLSMTEQESPLPPYETQCRRTVAPDRYFHTAYAFNFTQLKRPLLGSAISAVNVEDERMSDRAVSCRIRYYDCVARLLINETGI
jgi:hypothetical protein